MPATEATLFKVSNDPTICLRRSINVNLPTWKVIKLKRAAYGFQVKRSDRAKFDKCIFKENCNYFYRYE